jgi:hypothetical protein
MEHYVTLFDSLYLPQGISLHRSMERHIINYTLWIICMDKDTLDILNKMCLPNVKLLYICDLETRELLSVKPDRTKGEYCWTLSPFAPKFIFDADKDLNRVTYIDADMWFRNNPKEIFSEFDASGKSVLITEHHYAPEYDQSLASGKYCVQFMTFKRNEGEPIRQWWQDKCIEWCFARFEDGKFGDQKYLDDWTERFSNQVHVLKNEELILAPWNATLYKYENSILWHFQALRIMKKNAKYSAFFGFYKIPNATRKFIYLEYLKDLGYSISLLRDLDHKVVNQGSMTLWQKLKKIVYKFTSILNIPFNFNLAEIKISGHEIGKNKI